MSSKKQSDYKPVPFQDHYNIFKGIESRIITRLGELDREELLVGLRVAYDFLDSGNEPDVMPYAIEFGYVAPINNVVRCSQTDETMDDTTWLKITHNRFSLDFLGSLYDETRSHLEKFTDGKLKIDISMALYHGSSIVYRITCACGKRPRLTLKICYYDPSTKGYIFTCNCSSFRC